jgi:hypothetical protein
MYETARYDAALGRALREASEFERRRYRSLDWRGQFGVLMLVADGWALGGAIKEAAPYAADWTASDPSGNL